MPAQLAQRGVPGVQRASPAVRRPAGRLVGTSLETASASGARPAAGRHRRMPARSATAASSRLPCPRRPQRGSTSRVETSVVGPAGSGCLARRPAPPGRRRRSRRRCSARGRPARRCAGVGGVATAACHSAAADGSSQSSSTAAGSTERYAVRQVTAWTRAISAASAARAGRTETSAEPVSGGRGVEVHGGSVGGPRGRDGGRGQDRGRERRPGNGCPAAWPAGSRWPPRASPSRGRRHGQVRHRQLRRLDRLAVVQIDSVNVLSRSHYLPFFSRLGRLSPRALDGLAPAGGAACSSTGRTRRRSSRSGCSPSCAGAWPRPRARLGRHGRVPARAARVRRRGARAGARRRAAQAAELLRAAPERPGTMWNWHAGKAALEWLFFTGVLTARAPDRRGSSGSTTSPSACCPRDRRARPRPTAPTPSGSWSAPPPAPSASPPSATCATTSGCPVRTPAPAIAELADAGELLPVEVDGWGAPGLAGPRGAPAALDPGAGAAEPVRLPGLGAAAGRADLRLPLPAGDLHPGGQAGARLLRAAVPARRPAGGPGRPQGRPPGRGAARPGRARASTASTARRVAAALRAELGLLADWLELDDVDVAGRRRPRRGPEPCVGGAAGAPRLTQGTGTAVRWMRRSPDTGAQREGQRGRAVAGRAVVGRARSASGPETLAEVQPDAQPRRDTDGDVAGDGLRLDDPAGRRRRRRRRRRRC